MNIMDYNDYELLSLAKEKDENAINILYKKYEPLITNKAKKIYQYLKNKGVEEADLIQEGMIGFDEAIRDYDEANDVLFYTFASLCIDRQMNTVIKKMNRDKNKFLNEAISLDYAEDDENSLLNYISLDKSPEDLVISDENSKNLEDRIRNSLTELEETVFLLKLQDFNYHEISDILDKDDKAIDNALQRIRFKIKKIMQEEKE